MCILSKNGTAMKLNKFYSAISLSISIRTDRFMQDKYVQLTKFMAAALSAVSTGDLTRSKRSLHMLSNSSLVTLPLKSCPSKRFSIWKIRNIE